MNHASIFLYVARDFAITLAIAIGFWAVFSLLAGILIPRDDSDSPESRSGLTLRTDHKTGCQYLESKFSGLTPRVDGNGAHVGCKP